MSHPTFSSAAISVPSVISSAPFDFEKILLLKTGAFEFDHWTIEHNIKVEFLAWDPYQGYITVRFENYKDMVFAKLSFPIYEPPPSYTPPTPYIPTLRDRCVSYLFNTIIFLLSMIIIVLLGLGVETAFHYFG